MIDFDNHQKELGAKEKAIQRETEAKNVGMPAGPFQDVNKEKGIQKEQVVNNEALSGATDQFIKLRQQAELTQQAMSKLDRSNKDGKEEWQRLNDLYIQIQQALAGVSSKMHSLTDQQAQLSNAAATNAAKYKMTWQQAQQEVFNSFNSGFTNWVDHGGSAMKILQGMEVALVNAVIKAELQKLEHRIVSAELGATASEAGAVRSKLADQTAASHSQLQYAKVAAAKAYSAFAQVPLIGPILGAAAAAVVFAACMAFEKGGIVPETQMAMVHKNEMVLPAHLSNFVRNAAENGSGGGSSVGAVHIHNTINGGFDPAIHSKMMVEGMKKELMKRGVRM